MAASNSMAWSDPARSDQHRDWLRLAPETPDLNPSRRPGREVSGELAIPASQSVISLVAGSFAEPVSQIWCGERIKQYLTATDARRHLWHAWLSSECISFTAQNPVSADLAHDRLTFLKGRDLIIEAYGHQPSGLTKALSRLGAEARTPEFYRALIRSLSYGGAGAKFLQHTPKLPDDVVFGLAALPAGLSTKGVLELLKRSRIAPEALGFFTWTLSRLEILLGPGVGHSVLQAAKPLDALWEVILSLPFPKAPWSGTDQMVPIGSLARFQKITHDFDNCLAIPDRQRQAIVSIINRERYFYEWKGEHTALLECRRVGDIGWYLQQVRGPKNRDVSQSTRDAILNTLSQVSLFCPVWDAQWCHYPVDDLLRGVEF